MISEEEVLHIANLAKLNINDVSKYQKQLTEIFGEINKINEIEISDDIMISPCSNVNNFNEDVITSHISKDDLFKNAKHRKGDYIVVPKVIE